MLASWVGGLPTACRETKHISFSVFVCLSVCVCVSPCPVCSLSVCAPSPSQLPVAAPPPLPPQHTLKAGPWPCWHPCRMWTWGPGRWRCLSAWWRVLLTWKSIGCAGAACCSRRCSNARCTSMAASASCCSPRCTRTTAAFTPASSARPKVMPPSGCRGHLRAGGGGPEEPCPGKGVSFP